VCVCVCVCTIDAIYILKKFLIENGRIRISD